MRSEGRKLLFSVSHIDQLKARRAEMPNDFGYIALTGEVFGAPGSLHEAPVEPERRYEPADDDLPW